MHFRDYSASMVKENETLSQGKVREFRKLPRVATLTWVDDEPLKLFYLWVFICLQEHQHKQCEMLLIEQALTVVEGHGDDTTTIQIPVGHLGGDTTQLLVDGKHVNVLDNMNFEQVSAVTGRWRCGCTTFRSFVYVCFQRGDPVLSPVVHCGLEVT